MPTKFIEKNMYITIVVGYSLASNLLLDSYGNL